MARNKSGLNATELKKQKVKKKEKKKPRSYCMPIHSPCLHAECTIHRRSHDMSNQNLQRLLDILFSILLFGCTGGMRSTQSTSALSSIPYRASAHRVLKGHRTHGSQTALNFLSVNCSPTSPHRIPRALHHPQDFAQSAPAMGEGLLASEGGNLSHGQSHGRSRDPVRSSSGSSLGAKDCRRLLDSSEGLAALR